MSEFKTFQLELIYTVSYATLIKVDFIGKIIFKGLFGTSKGLTLWAMYRGIRVRFQKE